MVFMDFIMSWRLWFWTAILLFIIFVGETILLIIFAKKTHATVEFNAWRKGIPIAMFFQDSGYLEWKPIKPEAGIMQDDDYGTYLISERGTYIDRRTKNIMIPFDANLATSINVSAAKLADDLKYVLRDEKQLAQLRQAVMLGQIKDNTSIDVLKTSVQFSSIKGMMNAIIPHNISAKIEKMIAARLKGVSKINVPQLLLIFVVMLGAILLGVLIIKSTLGGGGGTAAVVASVANVVPTTPVEPTPAAPVSVPKTESPDEDLVG